MEEGMYIAWRWSVHHLLGTFLSLGGGGGECLFDGLFFLFSFLSLVISRDGVLFIFLSTLSFFEVCNHCE